MRWNINHVHVLGKEKKLMMVSFVTLVVLIMGHWFLNLLPKQTLAASLAANIQEPLTPN